MQDEITQEILPTKEQRHFASIRSAASSSNVPFDILRAAKSRGCPGFASSGRVDMELVRPWLSDHMEELQADCEANSKEYWALERLKFQALREKFAYESDQKLYLKKEEVAAQLLAVVTATKSILRSTLEDELPPKLAGQGEIEIREALRKTVDSICTKFQEGLSQ